MATYPETVSYHWGSESGNSEDVVILTWLPRNQQGKVSNPVMPKWRVWNKRDCASNYLKIGENRASLSLSLNSFQKDVRLVS